MSRKPCRHDFRRLGRWKGKLWFLCRKCKGVYVSNPETGRKERMAG